MGFVEKKRICIGNDEFLEFLPTSEGTVFNVDLILKPLTDFLEILETNCVSDCCGIDAFNFLPENVQNASRRMNRTALVDYLNILISLVKKRDIDLIESRQLNHYLPKDVFIKLIEHFIIQTQRAAES